MTAYYRSKIYSNDKLSELKQKLTGIPPTSEVVLTCGSYARREASHNSDIDFFVITEAGQAGIQSLSSDLVWIDEVKRIVSQTVKIDPAEGGAFAKVVSRSSLLQNMGGENDTNQNFTRRMLFLLEGEALTNYEGLRKVRHEILERYIGEKISDHQLALFLLNDFIRYYRTMAVDYEFKTVEGAKPKPWGLRNIKLVFSRKLLYASGLFSVALTSDKTRCDKIDCLEELFDLPVIERMEKICGVLEMERVLSSYNYFLEKIEDTCVRNHLRDLKKEDRQDVVFRDLKNKGHQFTRELLKLFENTFDSTHPIRKAVIF